ncbi:hypothetical protein COSO111634_08390 [Corallococcus soli]
MGAPDSRVRITSVLTKKPTSPWNSARSLPAMAVPTLTSSCPAWRASTAWNPASSTMKGVTPSRTASVRTASVSVRSNTTGRRSPRASRTTERGRSVGSSSSRGAPESCRFQYVSRFSSAGPSSPSRCQSA